MWVESGAQLLKLCGGESVTAIQQCPTARRCPHIKGPVSAPVLAFFFLHHIAHCPFVQLSTIKLSPSRPLALSHSQEVSYSIKYVYHEQRVFCLAAHSQSTTANHGIAAKMPEKGIEAMGASREKCVDEVSYLYFHFF